MSAELTALGWRPGPEYPSALLAELPKQDGFLFAGHARAATLGRPAGMELGASWLWARDLLTPSRVPRLVQLFACSAGSVSDEGQRPLGNSWAPAFLRAGTELVLAPNTPIAADDAARLLAAWAEALSRSSTVLEAWTLLNRTELPGLASMRLISP